ncbi:O-antigen ligase family protein [uncultured Croceitalea sp.]|uniref:O-antigen ligase family protein n=1 Tax=uncultured Croceitalea sp. TaxID=1798908 RepID=UPI003306671C
MRLKLVGVEIGGYDILASICLTTLPWTLKGNSISLIIFFVSVGYLMVSNKERINLSFKTISLASTFFLVAFLWLLSTSNILYGLNYLLRIISGFLLPFFLAGLFSLAKIRIKSVVLLFFVSCLLRYSLFLFEVIELELIFILDYWIEVTLQFNQLFNEKALHTTYFSMFLGFCSLSAYHFIKQSRAGQKMIWAFVLFSSLLMSFTLMAKMPFLANCLVIVFWLLKDFFQSESVAMKTMSISSIVVLTLYFIMFPNPFKQDVINYMKIVNNENAIDVYDYDKVGLKSNLENWEKTNRLHIWKTSIETLKGNWLFGSGTGDIDDEMYEAYKKLNKTYFLKYPANTHNQYLDYFIRYGILGFLIIILSFGFYFFMAIKHNQHVYLGFLVLVAMCCLTENILNRQFGIVFFFFFNSFFLLICQTDFE